MSVLHVVSLSSGKDSSATAILALETMPRESLRFISCDTGNEHESFLPYLRYMERHLGIQIDVLVADFSEEIVRSRDYVREHWPRKGVPKADINRALKALVPTGNPFLDLCIWKGRFPSRRAQFCTEFLKIKPSVEYMMTLIERGEAEATWSWQGVRIDESHARRTRLACPANIPSCDKSFEVVGGGLYNYRPILRWTAEDCFGVMRDAGLEPNPLYTQGMNRVGCMPCINASKDEVFEISKRFPGHIDRIEYWESLVAERSKRQAATFFADPDRDAHLNKRGIRNYIGWASTGRGGKTLDWIKINEEPRACSSAYGLCE